MAIKIMNAKTLAQDARIKMLVYGDSGVGKTVFSASFPKPFVIASEEGLLSVAGRDIPYVPIHDWADMESIYLHLLKDESKAKYETVVVDSLTDLQQKCLAYVLQQSGRPVPEQRDWGQLLDVMRRFLRQMADLPYHIVFICLAGTEKDELLGMVKERPAISGRLAVEAPAYVDMVMRLVVEQSKKGGEVIINRYGVFQPDSRAAAKDRSGKMPTVMKDPDADKIFGRLTASGAKSSGTTAHKSRKKRTTKK